MKLVLKIASIGALGLLLLFVALSLAMNPLLAKVLRAGVTSATGTATLLASVDLGLVSGRLDLSGFAIANPEGFSDEPFLALESGRVEIESVAALLGDAVELRSIELDGVRLQVEAHGLDTNYGAILETMRGLPDGEQGSQPPSEGGPSKTLTVGRIVVTGIRAELVLDTKLAGGSSAITIPRLEVDGFSTAGSTAQNVARLTRAVLEALLQAVLEQGGNVLPTALLGDLEQELGDLRGTIEEGARGAIQAIQQGAPLEEVGQGALQAADEVKDAVKGLLGKPKKPKK